MSTREPQKTMHTQDAMPEADKMHPTHSGGTRKGVSGKKPLFTAPDANMQAMLVNTIRCMSKIVMQHCR